MYWELERDPAVSGLAGLRRNKRSIVLDLKTAEDRVSETPGRVWRRRTQASEHRDEIRVEVASQ